MSYTDQLLEQGRNEQTVKYTDGESVKSPLEVSGENLQEAIFEALAKSVPDCQAFGMDESDMRDQILAGIASFSEYADMELRP